MREDPGNNRPIGVTSVPGRAREKIILGADEKAFKKQSYHQAESAQVHEGEVLP